MSVTPYPIQVYRNGKWAEVQTDSLFPGDVVSIGKSC
jgi:manganese-transporting P-type ATPase